MFADLHLHSVFSDGTDTPRELCAFAKKQGIRVLALTDHDSVDGVEAMLAKGQTADLKVIPGIEISTEHNRKLLHVLGYYIDYKSEVLSRFLQKMTLDKTENTRLNFQNAIEQGCFEYPWERVLELNREQRRLSGVHVVKAMQIDGYEVPGMGLWDMFRRHFLPSGSAYVETKTASGNDAIDMIRQLGGIPIIAHPKSVEDDEKIKELLAYGAMGLEVYHPSHSKEETQKYLKMAQEKRCLVTGGSDWHGKNSGKNVTHIGITGLPGPDYAILSQALAQ